jgi:opacity protein-like surface antigen
MTFKRLILLLVLLTFTGSVHAQRFNKKQEYDGLRDGTWEASLLIGSQSSLDFAGENGSSLKIDSELAWGFTFGWNWTPNLNFSYRFMLAKPGYTATIVPEDPDISLEDLDYSADRYSNQLNATYHFFKGPFTPYIQAGVGYAKLDSNVPSQPPDVGCWWDPWWGYICFTDWSTYDATGFSYNLGVGLRWDVNGALFMKGAYNREFFSGDRADFDFDTLTLEAGLMW